MPLIHSTPEMRHCAFLDILGFKATLEEIEGNPGSQKLRRLVSCLNFMSEETGESAYSADLPVYETVEGGVVERELGDPRLTYVSDCIIISTQYTAEGLNALCRKVSKIWLDLGWDGAFSRAAISAGLLFHQGNIVFGSAYLKAYELESSAAVFPRVIVDRPVVENAGGFPGECPLRPPTAKLAADGQVYLAYFPFQFYPPYAYNWSSYLLRVRGHIERALSCASESIRAKYEFLRTEFNDCVEEYAEFLESGVERIASGSA